MAAVLTGIAAGFGAIVMMGVLRAVQHAAFDYHVGEYVVAVTRTSATRRVVVLAVGGLVTGAGLWIMRRHAGGTGGEPTHVVWSRSGSLSLVRTLIGGALSEVTVGMGGSLGREAAPQRTGAAAAASLGRRLALPPEQCALLIACGAGAGLAAVYNVPLAGALFTAEIYLGTMSLSALLPALLTAGIATAIAWITLPAHAVYSVTTLPTPTLSLIVFALLLGPVVGVASASYVRLIAWASDNRPTGLLLLVEPLLVFAALGLLAIRYPLLLGNGTDLAQFAFTGSAGLLMFAALAVLKPLVTSACLRSGASGGLFTPTLSFGAVLGALVGHAWALMWPGSPTSSYAVIAAAAMVAAAAQAPVTGIAFVLELTHGTIAIVVPVLLAVAGATLTSRALDMRSIYSARLSSLPRDPTRPNGASEGDTTP